MYIGHKRYVPFEAEKPEAQKRITFDSDNMKLKLIKTPPFVTVPVKSNKRQIQQQIARSLCLLNGLKHFDIAPKHRHFDIFLGERTPSGFKVEAVVSIRRIRERNENEALQLQQDKADRDKLLLTL